MDQIVKLDKLDRKLLVSLDKNSRASYSALAKELRSTPELIRYRVLRLDEQGVVQRFYTVVEGAKVGATFHKVYLAFHNVDEEKVQKIVSYLTQDSRTVWVARLDGTYDLGITVSVAALPELHDFFCDLLDRFSDSIRKRVFSVNIQGDYLLREYFVRKERARPKIHSYRAASGPGKLDEINAQILGLLTNNSRLSYSAIGEEVGLSDDAISSRIRTMEKQGIIVRYNLILNHAALNQMLYKVLIHLNNVSSKKQEEFLRYCRRRANIVFIVTALGEWDYELDIEVSSYREYRSLMMDLTRKFSDVISDYQPHVINEIHKYNYYPP